MLSGLGNMSFLLEHLGSYGRLTLLQPRCLGKPLGKPGDNQDYSLADAMGGWQPWTPAEIQAAAHWWRNLAAGNEPQDRRHVWFGGGIAFGRVSTRDDFAIDILVMDNPNAQRPAITYDHGQVDVEYMPYPSLHYITVDTTADQVHAAAYWWTALSAAHRHGTPAPATVR